MKHLTKTTMTPSTASQAAMNIPPGVAVSTPLTGDIWHENDKLKFKSAAALHSLFTEDAAVSNSVTEDLGVRSGAQVLDYRGNKTCKYIYLSGNTSISFLLDDIGVKTRLIYLHVHKAGNKTLDITWPVGSEESLTAIPLRESVGNSIDVIVFAHLGGALHLVSAPGITGGGTTTIVNGNIDGGEPNSTYLDSQVIDGGAP